MRVGTFMGTRLDGLYVKVNVAVYKELFSELTSGHVTIVTRVR